MEKLRIGVIGTGSVVREIYRHLYFHSEYAPRLSIEAAADPYEKGLNEFCDQYAIPPERRFGSYEEMLDRVRLDAVQVNTPDHLHEQPTIHALEAGLDVVVPKPLSDSIQSAHRMIEAARASGRLLGVDFHKRDDPRIKEAAARYQRGEYGTFQAAVWYMLDKLLVADPNHVPRFFASSDFAAKNSPISFLTVHMADAFIRIVNLKPVRVRANGWRQKLPSLAPIAVHGYDLCDTEVTFENGGVAHIVTGWHLPNAAHSTTVQSARIICTEGMLDLDLDMPGYHELGREGIQERNPLFRNFEADGLVTGYGISHPGRLYQKILRARNGTLEEAERQRLMNPVELGFWTTVVLEAAEQSLSAPEREERGAIHGKPIEIAALLQAELGAAAGQY
ncbi:MAG: Gfo/Idh/MocA family oxidoreductase [Verrucomicrobia bacterium]|jgi:predicted dehydrogenase|nr:Gfo/Idh/MocA family oxidoreductase [Verrucomicrobiota bacterium]